MILGFFNERLRQKKRPEPCAENIVKVVETRDVQRLPDRSV